MSSCCYLVGNYKIGIEGIISISSKGNTPVQLITDGTSNVVTVAPSTGTLSVTAYAADYVHKGCSGKAGVTINWITRTDCDKNIYLFGGAGKSYIQGDVGTLAKFPSITGISNPVSSFNIIDASSSSGPSSLYVDTYQEDGYGLEFKGTPWDLNTDTEAACKIDVGFGGYGECMLQSLSVTCTPNQVPTVSYDFIYSL